MSSSTALLPKGPKKDDHPIFLRVCHSPWVQLGQKALSTTRGIIAVYMLVAFILSINFEIRIAKHGWLIFFELSNIAYFLQLLYAWIAFSWTYMHLHYPHHASKTPSHATRFQKLLSPPRTHPTTKSRAFFSIFYTASLVFPHVVTLIFWSILVPKKETTYLVDDFFNHGWYRSFWVLNKFAVNSVIALIEVLFLSSIRRQTPIWAHATGLAFLADVYVGWAFIGHLITGQYAYFFFDHKAIGWEYVATAICALNALPNFFFCAVYGLTGLREIATKRGEDKSYGYNRLPQ